VKIKIILLIIIFFFFAGYIHSATKQNYSSNYLVEFDQLPDKWNKSAFSGNGQIGALLYARNNSTLEGTLDHHLLWEHRRPCIEQKPVSKFKDHIARGMNISGDLFQNCSGISATKLPALAYRFEFPNPIENYSAGLDHLKAQWNLNFATGNCKWTGEMRMNSCCNVLSYTFNRTGKESIPVLKLTGWDRQLPGLNFLDKWNVPIAIVVKEGNFEHLIQKIDSNSIAILTCMQMQNRNSSKYYLTVSIGSLTEENRIKTENIEMLRDYSDNESTWIKRHEDDWKDFWCKSSVQLPDKNIQTAYMIEEYKMYCNIRPDSTVCTLQGVFNNAEDLPPWSGDLHNDLNVQACYWPVYKTNRAYLASAYPKQYASMMNKFTKRAKEFFDANGISIPTCMDINGNGIGEEYSYWNTLLGPELFVAADMCWYWNYTHDKKMLEQCIYPLVSKAALLYKNIAIEGSDGKLHIPHTHSPEVFEPGYGLLFSEDSTFIVQTLKYICPLLDEFENNLNLPKNNWQSFSKRLVDLPVSDKGIQLFPGIDLKSSHRHFCNLYPIFPLNTLNRLEPDKQKIMFDSLQHIRLLGTGEFASWSFPYLSIFASRLGYGNMARTEIELYLDNFRSPNTFTVNGDAYNSGLVIMGPSAGQGDSSFTLEAGFIVPTAGL
jgi:hypothetical protein